MGALGSAVSPLLARELREAVAGDERQAREEAAKVRAVGQRVSYREFRNMVLASHLKPLEKKDKMGDRRTVLWNPCAARTKAPHTTEVEIPQEMDQLPGTSAEFYRDWRRCLKSGKEKYQFLLRLGGEALGRIFQVDLGFGLLGEFLAVLAEHICPADRAGVLQVLQSLSGTKRFGLSLDLLSQSEKESSREVFRKLQTMSRGSWNSAGHPGRPTICEAESETHPVGTSLQEESEEERLVMELMKRYQVS